MRAIVSCARLVRAHWPAILTAMALASVTTVLQALVAHLVLRDVEAVASATFPAAVRIGAVKHVFGGVAVTVESGRDAMRVLVAIMGTVVGMTVTAALTGCASSYLLHRVTFRTMRNARNRLHRESRSARQESRNRRFWRMRSKSCS